MLRRSGLRSSVVWGPRFPGIDMLVGQYSVLEVCALQWARCVEGVLNCVRAHGQDLDYLEVRYEDLVSHPTEELQRVFDFAGLTPPADLGTYAARVEPRDQGRWRTEMSKAERGAVNVLIADTLERLDYPPDDMTACEPEPS